MGKSVLKGNILLDIDAAGLKAEIVYTPGQDADTWNEDGVFKLLADRGVHEGVKSDAVRNFFGRSADTSPETVRFPVAEGTPPGLPAPTAYSWTDMPVPDEFAEDIEKVLLSSLPPEIFKTAVKKIRVSKKVLKKPKHFLGKPREEIVETTESREVKEKVDVVPDVKASGWIEAGGKVADITPPVPGVPGKDVFGKPIPPEMAEENFYLGRGIEKKGKELIAGYSGVFRRGENWAEILPFQNHEWSLSFSRDNVTCLLDFTPGGTDAGIPDPAAILKEAEGLGVDLSNCISSEALLKKLKDAVREGRSLQQEPLSGDSDGFFSIDIPDDKMSARLTMIKGRGNGRSLVLKEVGGAIKKSGIKGLDLEKIKQDILTFYKSREHELKDYLLAEGTAPVESGKIDVKHEAVFLEEERTRKIRELLEKDKETYTGQFPSLEDFPPSLITEAAPVQEGQVVAVVAIQKGESGKDIFGNVVPSSTEKNPGYTLYENLRQEDNSLISTIDGILDWAETPEGILLRCRPHRDAVVSLDISPDSMTAFLSLSPAVGTGSPLSPESVHAAVEEKEITTGLNNQAIEDAIRTAEEGNPVTGVPIASGTPPTNQGESRLAFEIQLSSGKGVSLRKDGSADFKNQDRITTVREGMRIARIQSPDITPQDGIDIFGRTVKAQAAPPLNLQIGEHIRQEEDAEGTVILYADHNGELVYDGNSISIRNVHSIKGDVGPKTGNVKFSGSVEITGSILPGYAVFSGSDILIGENIEAGLVSADGSIRVNQGIKGGGKAVLRAKQEVSSAFIEQAMVLAVGDVQVKNGCLRSSVKTNGQVNLLSDKGDLIGGIVRARRGISAANIGTEKGIKTHISFGQDYLVADRIELEEKEIGKLKEAIAAIDSSLRQYEKVDDRSRLATARKEKLKYLKMIEKRSIRLFNYREKFEEHVPSTITVRDTLYPGVVFESHGRFKEITAPQKGVTVSFDPRLGQINIVSGSDTKE